MSQDMLGSVKVRVHLGVVTSRAGIMRHGKDQVYRDFRGEDRLGVCLCEVTGLGASPENNCTRLCGTGGDRCAWGGHTGALATPKFDIPE